MDNFVLYWMQQSQRTRYNKALNYAIETANKLEMPLIVCFIVTDFPEAKEEHYAFMMDGIREVEENLKKLGIGFILRKGEIVSEVIRLADQSEFLVMDKGYLAIQREWRKRIASSVICDFEVIDSDTIIPVTIASDKQETAARTLRFKINKYLPEFMRPIPEIEVHHSSLNHKLVVSHKKDSRPIYDRFSLGNQKFTGGIHAAQKQLKNFIENKLPLYDTMSNDPSLGISSRMSPYLHFGQISSLDIAIQIKAGSAAKQAKEAYLEQLIVRRELAINFIWFTKGYDTYQQAVPLWARESLEKHRHDAREYIYSLEALENADTHDPYWNAAQNELLQTGFMHNYMRMYWAKKIIEWTPDAETAFDLALYLNNKYQFDGRDANSFAGIAWTFGRHDHPWKERNVFGKIRYMNAKGLERKFKIKDYSKMWNK